jgi:hypothetical protein
MELIWICSAAFFVALGLICFVRVLADSLFFPKQLRPAIILRTREDADLLDMLLHEARFASFSHRAVPIVLIGEELRGDGELMEELKRQEIEYQWME